MPNKRRLKFSPPICPIAISHIINLLNPCNLTQSTPFKFAMLVLPQCRDSFQNTTNDVPNFTGSGHIQLQISSNLCPKYVQLQFTIPSSPPFNLQIIHSSSILQSGYYPNFQDSLQITTYDESKFTCSNHTNNKSAT